MSRQIYLVITDDFRREIEILSLSKLFGNQFASVDNTHIHTGLQPAVVLYYLMSLLALMDPCDQASEETIYQNPGLLCLVNQYLFAIWGCGTIWPVEKTT